METRDSFISEIQQQQSTIDAGVTAQIQSIEKRIRTLFDQVNDNEKNIDYEAVIALQQDIAALQQVSIQTRSLFKEISLPSPPTIPVTKPKPVEPHIAERVKHFTKSTQKLYLQKSLEDKIASALPFLGDIFTNTMEEMTKQFNLTPAEQSDLQDTMWCQELDMGMTMDESTKTEYERVRAEKLSVA